jgi:transcriptional regulator with PAS, ATPase and Fis domain
VAAETRTETALDGGTPAQPRRAPHLFVVLDGAAPLAGGLRIRLDGVEEIVLGRGEARAAALSGDGRTLELRLPDRRISSRHARLRRGLAGWELEDAGSKNGTRVDGEPATRVSLDDGALILVGHTVLRLRDELEHDGGDAIADDPAPLAGVATLLPGLAARLAELVRLAPSAVPLVLGGETGTGKEVVARAVHAASGRRGDFVAVNCAALPAGLVEGELFGHRRGAFTGALDDKPGLIRAADGGTLLLDEIGDLAAPAQAALLRVLQEREVVPLGDSKPLPVDVRVIAASHHDLDALVARGALRADLHARLAGHTTVLPPLRERREDIGALIAALVRRHAGARAAEVELTPEASYRLVAAPWPGNVRGLEKAIETALALAPPGGGPIGLEHLRAVTAAPTAPPDDDALRARLTALLSEHHGNISQVARAMGKARMQVQRWLKRFDLDPARFRG